jgi:uncharacterized membrane protein SpoIIM required for sporulation
MDSFSFLLFIVIAFGGFILFSHIVYIVAFDVINEKADDKIANCFKDIDKLLSPHGLEVMRRSNNCWTIYDCACSMPFSVAIPASKFLFLLKQLKYGKITTEDFLSYLRNTEIKHTRKLQKSKEL